MEQVEQQIVKRVGRLQGYRVDGGAGRVRNCEGSGSQAAECGGGAVA